MSFTSAQLTDLQSITTPSPSIAVKVVKAKSHNSLMCAHAREGIFLKCKNVHTHFTPSLVAYFPIIILHLHHCSSLPYHHRTLFLPLSHFRLLLPSAVSQSPTILFPPLPLFCFHQSPTLRQHSLTIITYVSPAHFAHSLEILRSLLYKMNTPSRKICTFLRFFLSFASYPPIYI